MKKLVFIAVWVGFLTIKIPVVILGLPMVALMYPLRYSPLSSVLRWKVFTPWTNPEDWNGGPEGTHHSLPQWWIDKKGFGFWSWWWYHSIRNPANGLRNYEWLDLDIVPELIEYEARASGFTHWKYFDIWYLRENNVPSCWYWCWQGWKAGFLYRRIFKGLSEDLTVLLPNLGLLSFLIWKRPKNTALLTRVTLLKKGPRHMEIKLGWRVHPWDKHMEIDPDGVRKNDAGFATKFLPYREG